MKIRALGARVVLSLEKEEETRASGIILTRAIEEGSEQRGVIIGLGDTKDFPALELGQKVVYAKNKGEKIKEGEEEFLVLPAEDIVAIID